MKSKSQRAQKPNIILIYADDISARELPIYNSSVWSMPSRKREKGGSTSDPKYRAQTPVLDRLAIEGCYVKTAWAATVCSPSRAMMMTGRYAHLHHWWHNGDYGKTENGKVLPLYQSSPMTIGHIAKMGGYATFWTGKTQMKNADLSEFGFDEGVFTPGQSSNNNNLTDFKVISKKIGGKNVLVNLDNGEEVDYYIQSGWLWKPHVQLMKNVRGKYSFEWWPNTEKSRKEFGLNTYGPDVELESALEFIERKSKEKDPFFIYHTSHLGHDAWDFIDTKAKSKWPGTPKISWDGKAYHRVEPNITGDHGIYDSHGTVTEDGIHTHINYLDYQAWRYIEKLKQLDLLDNTLIIFSADNGTSGYGKASHELQKGTHVPLIIYAPGLGLTKKGEQNILVNISDILPTIAELAGVEIPKDYEINGESLWSYLSTDKQDHREWIYAYKSDRQLIRGEYVLRDGNNNWWDVSADPEDLISYPRIDEWENVSKQHRTEKNELLSIMPEFDLHPKKRASQHGL